MVELEMMVAGFNFFIHQPAYKVVKQEVPFLSRCIDIVLVNKYDEIISIEFKVSKWRHAIEQAVNHKLGADKSYICLPERTLTDALSEAIVNAKLGLLFYDSDAEVKIHEVIAPPSQSNNVLAFKKILMNNITKIK